MHPYNSAFFLPVGRPAISMATKPEVEQQLSDALRELSKYTDPKGPQFGFDVYVRELRKGLAVDRKERPQLWQEVTGIGRQLVDTCTPIAHKLINSAKNFQAQLG